MNHTSVADKAVPAPAGAIFPDDPACCDHEGWRDRSIRRSLEIIDALAPDAQWRQRHLHLAMSDAIHPDGMIAAMYIANLAQVGYEFVCRGRETGHLYAQPYRAYQKETRQ